MKVAASTNQAKHGANRKPWATNELEHATYKHTCLTYLK